MCQTPVLSAASKEFRFSNPEAIQARLFFGTTTVQLSERENGALLLKATPDKALGVCTFIVRDQGVGGSNPLSATNLLKINQLLDMKN
jgi:hypothetical protein